MDFGLSAKQLELQKKLRELFTKEIATKASAVDEQEAFPAENFRALSGAGYLGLTIPAEFGGAGEDIAMAVTAAEELSAACSSTALCAAASTLACAGAITKFGTPALKDKWLKKLATGTAIGAYALTDVGGGHLSDTKAEAVKTASGFELTGTKVFVTNGAVADLAVVIAMLDGKPTAFIVEKTLAGYTAGEKMKLLGMRGASASDIALEKCAVPAENLLGGEGGGEAVALWILDRTRLHTAVLSVGIGRSAYAEAKKRAETRISGGKPIGAYQEVSFRITDMYIEMDTARQLAYEAAWLLDSGSPDARNMIRMAKLYASEMAVRNANRAVQIFGGAGYVRDSVVERLYRDAKFTEIVDGTNEVLRMAIADEILKD